MAEMRFPAPQYFIFFRRVTQHACLPPGTFPALGRSLLLISQKSTNLGGVCVCGVPRQGIPPITRVACSPEELEARVVSVPVESIRRGGLFTPASLDSFLRLASVGCYSSSGTTPGKDTVGTASNTDCRAPSPLWQQSEVKEGSVGAVDVWGLGA